MRLDRIKLAGFKSFVDPTTIPTPGNLIGIVGPNGCGKSNIIDAVRWVMGESSAKHLRGESMADVIFNGSSSRKPVGLASVELVFDNSQGKAPGEFARFQEISIKRQVSRDGQSTYLLNGTRCRRKDITDLFLGTGLGSRSYAIIEQGTISRLIEAKPLELRELIEEAAGISRYKERRHETELRMGHTQENLDRLLDVREEIEKQIENLKKQAKKAEKYTQLKEQEQVLKETLLALRWEKHQGEFESLKTQLGGLESELRKNAGVDHDLSGQISDQRKQLETIQQELQDVQARFYELGSEISRLSQALQHAKETREHFQEESARLTATEKTAESDLLQDQRLLAEILQEKSEIDAQIQSAKTDEIDQTQRKNQTETDLQKIRSAAEESRLAIARHQSQISAQTDRLRQLDQQQRQLQIRCSKFEQEKTDLLEQEKDHQVLELQTSLAEMESHHEDILEQKRIVQGKLEELKADISAKRAELNRQMTERHTLEGQIASLETLQTHAMGKDRKSLTDWLSTHQLESTPRLAETLDVTPKWETAVETLLGPWLQSLCHANLAQLGGALEEIPNESIAIIARRKLEDSTQKGDGISKEIRCDWDLEALTGHVRCAESLSEALEKSPHLAANESLITPDGILVHRDCLIRQRLDDGQSGLIGRERALKALKQSREILNEQLRSFEEALAELENELSSSESRQEFLQSDERRISQSIAQTRTELRALEIHQDQVRKRSQQILAEIEETTEQLQQIGEEIENTKDMMEHASSDTQEEERCLEDLKAQRSVLEDALRSDDAALADARERSQALGARKEHLESTEHLTLRHIERLEGQLLQSRERMEALEKKAHVSSIIPEDAEAQLESLTIERQEVERVLKLKRETSTRIEREIREASAAKSVSEKEIDKAKDALERVRLELSANEARRQNIEEQIFELSPSLESVLNRLPASMDEKTCHQEVQEVTTDIQKLGPVNLTAMEEFLEQEQRLQFLDTQLCDLQQSLQTLNDAIQKIDEECRSRFKETFDLINSGLQRMFPKLFGGGQASLELTEKDLLESGVTVMARPPGKRNSSIHLLSGGEKALTAAALVFAIFELNPAPFCLLDEVDAPLDDANVGRFSQLVKEMSERVQFLFISHNKVTMEIAGHLAGVTMKEPGVSRIVAVDIDAAVEMSAA